MSICQYKVEKAKLYVPKLSDIKIALQDGLSNNFRKVNVSVVDCPDLTKFVNLSSKYICGSTKIADVGGVPYMDCGEPYCYTTYNIDNIIKHCDMKNACVFGASAASSFILEKNAELIPNTKVPCGPINTKYASLECIDNNPDTPYVSHYPWNQTGCLANLFLSDGKPGKVLHIRCEGRTGDINFTNCIRESLKNVNGYGINGEIGLGGVIKVLKGQIKGHIMPNHFPHVKIPNETEWLRYYKCGPNLAMFSVLMTDNPNNNFHLRLEHTHFNTLFNDVNEGGHYHYDLTPKSIIYDAYFSVANDIYQIDNAYNNVKSKL